MSNNFVAVLMGSDSDLPTMQACLYLLSKLGITMR
jgi:phosphoribosylcarboxyaminoimidazole (NCAIR) mutase